MPYQVDDALLHAMSGTELSCLRTELRLFPPEPNNQRLLASRGADIVMQSSAQKQLFVGIRILDFLSLVFSHLHALWKRGLGQEYGSSLTNWYAMARAHTYFVLV